MGQLCATHLRMVGLLLFVFTLAGRVALAQETPEASRDAGTKQPVRVLAVGNSFSDNATAMLPALAKAGGQELMLTKATMGGASLQQHWEKIELLAQDPAAEKGRYLNKKTLAEMLGEQPWDYVTIQQFSFLSHDPATHEPWAGKLIAYIRERVPGAELLVHQTWAYRADDPRFVEGRKEYGKPEGGPTSQREMYDRLTAAYDELAERYGARVIPVGDAFQLTDEHKVWGFKPTATPVDVAAFTNPALPEQPRSLHAGWMWTKPKEGEPKLIYDGHHAGLAGRYLGACVWYEVLFGESVVGNSFVPEGLDAEYAAFLQRVAHEAVERREAAVTVGAQ